MSDKLPPLTPEQDSDALAAELAMDLLDDAQRQTALDRLASDPDFATRFHLWQEALAQLSQDMTPVMAPTRSKVMIDRKLGHAQLPELQDEPRGPIPLTPLLMALAVVVALIAGVIFMRSDGPPTDTAADAGFRATLAAPEQGVQLRAVWDAGAQMLTISADRGAAPPGQDYQLWLVPADGTAPRPLAVAPREGRLSVALPASLLAGQGNSLALTQQAEGGAAPGQPAGPIIATAPISSP